MKRHIFKKKKKDPVLVEMCVKKYVLVEVSSNQFLWKTEDLKKF